MYYETENDSKKLNYDDAKWLLNHWISSIEEKISDLKTNFGYTSDGNWRTKEYDNIKNSHTNVIKELEGLKNKLETLKGELKS